MGLVTAVLASFVMLVVMAEKFLSQLKNREEFEGGLEKKEGKEENKKRVIKHTLKYCKKINKNREEF